MKKKIASIILIIIILAAGHGFAQQVTDTINLKAIEVIGVGNPNKTTFEKASIEQSFIPDVGTMLRTIPGVSGIKKGGSAIDPIIRGFRFSQLAVMADDGLKVEGGCPNRMDPVTSHIETDDIESIEVIKGPYTLKYGPSLGGVIRLNTFTPKPYDHFQVHTRLHTSVSSNPAGFNQYILLHGGGKKVYFGLSGSYKNYGDYSDGDGNKVLSSFSKYNFSGDLGFVPHQDQEVILSFHRNYGRDIRFPALPMDEVKDNTTLLSADYHIKFRNRAIRKLDLKVYNSDVYHEMDNSLRPSYSQVVAPYKGLMQAVAKVNASNTGGRCEANIISGKHEVIAGLDAEIAAKDGGRVTTMIMTMNGTETTSKKTTNLWKEALMVNTGLFGEYTLNLPEYKVHFSARLDYNHANSHDTLILVKDGTTYFDDTRSTFINLSANAGISKPFGNGHMVSLYVGRGMRSPDLTERFIKFLVVGYDNYDYLGNPKLNPETNYQLDLITDINLGKAGKLGISGFASMVENYISGVIIPSAVATPKTMGALGVKQFMNTGKAYFLGFEASCFSPVYQGFSADLTAAITYGIHAMTGRNVFEDGQAVGTQDIKNDAVQEIPPFEARLNVNYTFFKEKMQAILGTRFVASQNHVSLAYYENATPGFVLMNMSYRYMINNNFTLSAGVQNLFNTTYYEHLNRRIVGTTDKLNEAGRNLYLNLVVTL